MQVLNDLWAEWWQGDIWIAPWFKALAGLSPEQAAWSPSPGRHSIWQLVNHIVYWREVTLDRIAGVPSSGREPDHDEQFPVPAQRDEQAWRADTDRLFRSHDRMRIAMAEASSLDELAADDPRQRLKFHFAHDAYHLGQIMYVRALLDLPPVL